MFEQKNLPFKLARLFFSLDSCIVLFAATFKPLVSHFLLQHCKGLKGPFLTKYFLFLSLYLATPPPTLRYNSWGVPQILKSNVKMTKYIKFTNCDNSKNETRGKILRKEMIL